MTAQPTDLPDLDIHTEHGVVTRLPTSFPLADPERDADLDPDVFQRGFDEALAHLAQLPPSWARHYAATTLDQAPDTTRDPSYTRGHRAGMYGYLRHG
ncbi:hypothetical protein [Gordonia sp. (in: high G+C Gram-positive bacteria)]|uniref:hypothetical protein n=1 Tax=Gordonia sp. (in: high G+C Gram-positive bacteria) TaxID=84139 RepID=UPI0016A68D94|nr:hypothetical protein [Gordonia sp. (in: high G+C Gram-positive bacteria)]NLG48076.1 hypothetical protein [Gordonia sp. (in: high G+C Gram-positive bacteria)]